jgi:hypothetical protein
MGRKWLVVAIMLAAMTTDAFAARRGGLVARWRSARSSRCGQIVEPGLATPQTAFDAYCRAFVGRDWGAFYDVMSRESQDFALVQAAHVWLYFVGDSYRGDADPLPDWEEFQRWHGLRHREWLRIAYEIDSKDGTLSLNFFPDRKPFSRAECREMSQPLRRQLHDPRTFYIVSMENFFSISEREGDSERLKALARTIAVPTIRDVNHSGRHALGVVTPSKGYHIHFSNDVSDQPVAFAFERGGWRIDIPPQ